MGYDYLIEIIETIGHVALFLVLCLGLIGLPIPNEAVALTGGALSQADILSPSLAFLMVWLGICSAMLFNFSIGRFTNSKLTKWFTKKNKSAKQIKFLDRSQEIIEKYGPFAIPICQFFPFIRHATPYLMGVNKMKLLRFAIFAVPTALAWTSLYFTIGYVVGDQIPELLALINRYEWIVFIILTVAVSIFVAYKIRTKLKLKSSDDKTLSP